MLLTVKERIIIPNLLPRQGKRIEMIVCKSIIDNVEFSIEEIEIMDIKDRPQGGFMWNHEKAKEKEVRFSNSELQFIKDCLKRKDDEGAISLDILALWDKFFT